MLLVDMSGPMIVISGGVRKTFEKISSFVSEKRCSILYVFCGIAVVVSPIVFNYLVAPPKTQDSNRQDSGIVNDVRKELPHGTVDFVSATSPYAFQTYIKSDTGEPNLLSIMAGEYMISFGLLDNPGMPRRNTVEKKISEGVTTFENVYDHVDLRFKQTDSRLLEEFIVENRQTAEQIARLDESVAMTSVSYHQNGDGSIDFLSTIDENRVFHVPAPVMYEEGNENEKNYGLHFEIEGDSENIILSKVIDPEGKDWLLDPGRNYPVVIDATVTIDTSTSTTPTAYSFQRKTWHDGTTCWSSFYSLADTRVEFWYSTDNGATWTENTSARRTLGSTSAAYSVYGDSNSVYLAYWDGSITVYVVKAASYPGNSFTWGTAYAAINTAGCNFSGITITLDSNNKIWVSAKYGFGTACGSFLAGTEVQMVNGQVMNIEDIREGDLVLGFEVMSGDYMVEVENRVTNTIVHRVDRYLDMRTESEQLLVTGNHEIYAGDGIYKRAEDIQIGDYIYRQVDSSLVPQRVISMREITEDVLVYDISTTGTHNFFANSSAVHNLTPPVGGYTLVSVQSTNANDPSAWQSPVVVSSISTDEVQRIAMVPLVSGNMYLIWTAGTNIYGKKYISGTGWDAAATFIDNDPASSPTKNVSAVVDPVNYYIHLIYTDGSNYMTYRSYNGTSWSSATTLYGTATCEYGTISLDTMTNDLYAFWIRSNHIYYKKADYTAGPTWTWDTNATDWKTTTTGVYITSNYSDTGKIYAEWSEGSSSPYSVQWDSILMYVAPTNDSLTFTNPRSSGTNYAVDDSTTSWNFRAVVSDNNGYGNVETVVLRLANASDNAAPFDSLKFTWTESADAFSETADTQGAATITSSGSDSSCTGNTCTLDFKITFNSNFSTSNTNYNAELFTTDDSSLTDLDAYTNFYNVDSLTVDTSTSATPTAYSFQRKTWYDGSRYWEAFHSLADARIEFWYSTDNGVTWAENTSARIAVSTNDFSILGDSANAFVVYTTTSDIRGQKATSYPGTGFSWAGEQVVLDGITGRDTTSHAYPVISIDSSGYIWMASRYHVPLMNTYNVRTIKEDDGTYELPEETDDPVYLLWNSMNSDTNVYGTLVGLASQDMYYIWIVGSSIRGAVWDNSDVRWEDSSGGTTYPDSVATGISGLAKNLSAVADPTNLNIHLIYSDSSSHMVYKERDGSVWDANATELDASATCEYGTLSLDTNTNDLYALWIRDSHIYYKKANYSSGPVWTWDTNATDWKTTTSGTYITSNNIGDGRNFAVWSEGSGSPYSIRWDLITLSPANTSLTFTNPNTVGSNDALADDSTEWNFRTVVSDGNGYTNLGTVVLRLANSSDNTTPFDSLKFTWTESTDSFSETADTQGAVTITSAGTDSSCAGKSCTLDFKLKFNTNFSAYNTSYTAELFTTDDYLETDLDSYATFYGVLPLFVDTSTSSVATAYSFQRKTWYDGTRYWSAFWSDGDDRIEFWYSGDDGVSWTENTSARIAIDTNDFSIEANSTNVFIAYTTQMDIRSKKGTSYPGTGFSWGTEYVVMDGSVMTMQVYTYPAMSRDSNSKLWVMAKNLADTPSFLAGVTVNMSDGTEKNIEDIIVGERVLSYDLEKSEFIPDLVLATTEHQVDMYYQLRTTDGEVAVTPTHPFLCADKIYRKAKDLDVGDSILMVEEGLLRKTIITEKVIVHRSAVVYDLTTQNQSNFFANRYLVHNAPFGNNISVRQSTNADDPSAWQTESFIDNSSSTNKYGTILSLGSGTMYALWIDGSAIEGKKYNGSSWDSSPTSIDTGVTGLTKNMSATVDLTNNYIHLIYSDSANNMVYKMYNGSSWDANHTDVDATATCEYAAISVDTSTNDLYALWVRSSHIYYKKADYSAGPTWTWDTNATDWKTTTSGTYVTSNYSGSWMIFAEWTEGSGSSYNVMWDLAYLNPNAAPTNTSLTFTNPYTGGSNNAVADNTTEWNLRAVVADTDGYANLGTVVLRLANSSDNTTPFDSLKFTWTESTDAFTETADTQNAAAITSTGTDSTCAGNSCTLDFKIKFNTSFSTQSTNYSAELYTTDDAAATDMDTYTDFYQVVPVTISISSPSDVSLGTITGTGVSNTGEATWTVTTNNPNGYKLEWQASTAGMISEYLDAIAAYSPAVADTPELWSVATNASEWGARLKSTSTDYSSSFWGIDDSSNAKWLNATSSALFQIANRSSPTAGSLETVQFKSEVGSAMFQPTGNYTVNVTATATTL